MRLPAIFTIIQTSISIFVIVIAYYTISNVTDKVINRLSNDLLNQSSKVAQQIFDERTTSAYYSLQALLSTAPFIEAIESKQESRINESLLDIYNFSVVNMPYDILFVHGGDNELLVDASYISVDSDLVNILNEMSPSKLHNMRRSLNYIKYKDLNLLVMKIEIPKTNFYLYGGIQMSANVALLQTIKQQTNSQCIQVYYQNELLATVGSKDDCNQYISQNLHSQNYFHLVKDGYGLIKRNISNQENLSFLDVAMLIPIDGILAFQKNLERFLFIVLIVVLGAALLIQFIFSKYISRSLSNIILFTQNKNHQLSDVPKTGIQEFDKIANVNHEVMLSLQDEIKARHETEIKLHQSNQELTLKTKQANIANEEKSRFLANISHEIRTPMNAIINLARFTLRTELTKRQQYYVDRIYHSSQTLLRLVNDVLDLSKIEANQVEIENAPFKLEKILEDVRDTVSTKFLNNKVEFEFDVDFQLPSIIIGDSLRIFQVLTNLCDNAAKFTKHGSVTLSIKQIERVNNNVKIEFSVTDTGIGIHPDKKKSIFDNFTQADTSIARQYGGTGLGLSIVKKLIDLMGGNIYLNSKPGVGSCFTFTLSFEIDKSSNTVLAHQTFNDDKVYYCISSTNNTMICTMFEKIGQNLIHLTPENMHSHFQTDDKNVGAIFFEWKNDSQRFALADIVSFSEKYSIYKEKIIWVREFDSEQHDKQDFIDEYHACISPITFSELFSLLQIIDSSNAKSVNAIVLDEINENQFIFENKKLLVAEDNVVNQEIIKTLLQEVGINADIVESGVEAINQLEKTKYDAVLMDVQMPLMNGIEATKLIRGKFDAKRLPIIGLSAFAMQSDINTCLRAGMNDYVDKPIDPKILYEILVNYLNQDSNHSLSTAQPETIVNVDIDNAEKIAKCPNIDVEQGLKRVSGNIVIYKRLLSVFYDSHKDESNKIEQALLNGDYDKVLELLHAIKGAASTISANDLFQSIHELECACKNGSVQQQNKKFLFFKSKLTTVLDSIQNGIQSF